MSDKPIDADCAGELTILPGERVDELQQAGLRILQKEQGFRFGMDAVLLSSFVRAESRDRCADFGTGTGILPLLLAGMGRAKSVDAFEIQPDMADMARRSVQLNGLEHIIRVHALPVSAPTRCLRPAASTSLSAIRRMGIMARRCQIRRKRCPWRAISRKAG